MSTYITIAAGITIAVTAKFMYLLFLSGKTLTNATLFGRFVSRIEPARRAFVNGWKRQSWRYLFIAYPCMLLSMAVVSLLLNWIMPAMDKTPTLSDKIRFCLLVFGVGVSASLVLALVLILLTYFCLSLLRTKWGQAEESAGETRVETKENAAGTGGEADMVKTADKNGA